MKFRARPVIKEAMQFDGSIASATDIETWTLGVAKPIYSPSGFMLGLRIKTIEGNMDVMGGDWIIKGLHGECYPCKPDTFEKTYEAVE